MLVNFWESLYKSA